MNPAEYKIRNLESQILYLQDEHSKTLKLLHNEIKDLQMKNSETSFQLIMANSFTNQSEVTVENQSDVKLLSQVTQLTTEVEDLTSQLNSKLSQLEVYEERIHRLNETISKLRLSHKKDFEAFEIELSAKSSEIVRLSTQLLNLKRLDESKHLNPSAEDSQHISPSPVLHRPISPNLFKFRNQVLIHPDNIHSRQRQISARQTFASTSLITKAKSPSPSFPEYAISVEDKSVFSKSIKRPSVLPPINPTKNRALRENHGGRINNKHDFGTDACHIDDINKSNEIDPRKDVDNTNHLSSDPKTIEVDRFMDVNNSSLRPSTKSIAWNVTKNSTA